MREIRTSGSTRGESVARVSVSPIPLLYNANNKSNNNYVREVRGGS